MAGKQINWSTDNTLAGGFGNTILYRMVEENLRHDDEDVIKGKMMIIGRTYSASVERGAGKKAKEQDRLLDYLAKDIKLVGSKLDALISKCRDLQRVSKDNLNDTLKAHKFLDEEIIKSIKEWRKGSQKSTKMEEEERAVHTRISFVSKYLHFHAPMAVFIFDSIAKKNLSEKLNDKLRKNDLKELDEPGEYARHCLKLLKYIEQEKYNDTWTPRLVDGHLLGYIKEAPV